MKLFSLLFAFLSVSVLVEAVAVVSEAELPTCALLCLETEILASSCSLTNTTCQCTNEPLVAAITTCVVANCTIKESLTTKAFTEDNCGATVRDRGAAVVIAAMTGAAVSFIAFALRIISRLTGASGKFWWDDAVMCLVIGTEIPLSAMAVVLSKHGFGRDIWTLSFEEITTIAYIYYWDELMYLTCLPLIKVSILLFYLRIFKEKSFRYMVFITMALCFAYLIAFGGAAMFQCTPIDGAWLAWDGTFVGHCNNLNLQGWTSAAVNIILDIMVIALPLPGLWKMNMSTQKKIGVVLMFCVGFFITIVSILRLTVLVEFGGTSNISWDYVPVGYWSTIEIHVGIICACMPAIRALYAKIFPKSGLISQSGGLTSTSASGAHFPTKPGKKDIGVATSIQISSKPKHSDTENFVPLMDLGSQLDLGSYTSVSAARKSEHGEKKGVAK